MTYKAFEGDEEETIVLEGRSIPVGFNNIETASPISNSFENYEKIKEFYESRL